MTSQQLQHSLFMSTIPVRPELIVNKTVINIRCRELESLGAHGGLLAHSPNLTQHHIIKAMAALERSARSIKRVAEVENIRALHKICVGKASVARTRLIPALYGAYLQDQRQLDLGACYWRIETAYLDSLQEFLDERSYMRATSFTNRLTPKERALFIDRYIAEVAQFVANAWNELADIRFALPCYDDNVAFF